MTQVRRIIQVKSRGPKPNSKISQTLHIHRKALDIYLSRIEASGKSFTELLKLSDDHLVELAYSAPAVVQIDERIEGT